MASWFSLGFADFTLVALIGILTGAISGWFSKYIFPKWLQEKKHELEDQSEMHRFQIKRQELMFDREFAAAEKLFVFYENAMSFQAGPYDDDPDHFGSIAAPKLGEWGVQITELIKENGTVLSDPTLKRLRRARHFARLGDTSWAEDKPEDNGPDYSPSKSTMDYLSEFAKNLDAAREQARADLTTGRVGRGEN